MIAIRHRWVHERQDDFLLKDIYRDVDTLERFVSLIGADAKFIEEIRKEKEILIGLLKDEVNNDNDGDNRKFKNKYDRSRVEYLCNELIQGKRGVTLGKDILKQLDQGYLNRSTYERLSRWVNTRRVESFAQPIAAEISRFLFGEEIKRIS